MDDLPGNPADYVVLICPPGAETAPISHGPVGYQAYPEEPGNAHSRWLVKVPRHVSFYLREKGGFWPLDPQ
jgi:hypothetical protein